MSEQKAIIAVFGHPDDEVWGTGGTLAFCAAAGVRVALVCATRGEVGEISDPSLATRETLGAVREAELRCSCQELGISDLYFLDYRDSGMAGTEENNHPLAFANADMDDAVGKLVRLVREIKPQVMITFDQNGAYGHPDHIKAYEVAAAAFRQAGDLTRFPEQLSAGLQAYAPQHLYFTAIPRSFFRNLFTQMKDLGIDQGSFGQIDIENFGTPDEEISATIDTSGYGDAKLRAFACHRTQISEANMFAHLPEAIRNGFMQREYFVEQGASRATTLKTDLFS